MHVAERWRWFGGAVLACGVIASSARDASADRKLKVSVINTSPDCIVDPSGNLVFGEAWGLDIFALTKLCETMGTGGTAMSSCPSNTLYHEAKITTRNPNNVNLLSSLYTSPVQFTWSSQSTQLVYNDPASANCPNGTTYYVISQGLDTPGATPP
jgi:hypothetical protein